MHGALVLLIISFEQISNFFTHFIPIKIHKTVATRAALFGSIRPRPPDLTQELIQRSTDSCFGGRVAPGKKEKKGRGWKREEVGEEKKGDG